eukprot:15200306-Ditylum_brightwellii.AAC.1
MYRDWHFVLVVVSLFILHGTRSEAFSPLAQRRSSVFRSTTSFISSSRSIRSMSLSLQEETISISDAFDGGNGEYVKTEMVDGVKTVFVRIRPDP